MDPYLQPEFTGGLLINEGNLEPLSLNPTLLHLKPQILSLNPDPQNPLQCWLVLARSKGKT